MTPELEHELQTKFNWLRDWLDYLKGVVGLWERHLSRAEPHSATNRESSNRHCTR